jgi:hypothetical protein
MDQENDWAADEETSMKMLGVVLLLCTITFGACFLLAWHPWDESSHASPPRSVAPQIACRQVSP